MGPKKQQQNQKTKEKKRSQAAADKTFGLKNKNKSSKVQKFVQQVEAQAKAPSSAEAKRKEAEAARKAAEKKAADQAREEARKLFSSVPVQKVPFGVDPKSVVCAFYKQGTCTKGKKCKFSHDLNVERKGVKKDLYSDDREKKEDQDTMENWDEEKLRKVVLSKHGNPQTTTDIVCKYFIEAVENGKYGWFWTCPNGGESCKYKHSLPPGFVLKTKEQKRLEREAAAKEPSITLEEFIETERHKLPEKLTPVTLESFTKWKQQRQDKKAAERELENKKKKEAKNLSGKELLQSGKYVDNEEDEGDAWDMTDLARRADEIEDEEEENDNE